MPLAPQVENFIQEFMSGQTKNNKSSSGIKEYRQTFDTAIAKGIKIAREFEEDIIIEEYPSPILEADKLDLKLRKYETQNNTSTTAIVLFAGTGFVHNNPNWNDKLHRALAYKTGYKIFIISGRVAPEYQFPIGFEDSYTTFRWLVKNKQEFNIETIGIGGFSSGGNFAALAAIRAKHDNIPLEFQILMSPFLDLSCQSEEYDRTKGCLFDKEIAQWLVKQYLPEGRDPREPSISPLYVEDLSGLPPTFIMATEFEPLNDECHQYANKLMTAGVQVTYHLEPGQIHEYLGCNRNRLVLPEADPIDLISPFLEKIRLHKVKKAEMRAYVELAISSNVTFPFARERRHSFSDPRSAAHCYVEIKNT